MVKIAIAGASSNIAKEIIDVLIATKRHELLLLYRNDVPASSIEGVTTAKVDYGSPTQLAQLLQGVHTVLSFIITQEDPMSTAQKNLINAAIQVGVKRFAPNEWASTSAAGQSWYAYKDETKRYLEELNKDKKSIEYSLFQPGMLLNYYTRPYQSSKYIHYIELPIDFHKRRALVLDGSDDDLVTLTTVQDLASVVAKAIDFKGEWPVVSGIQGAQLSIAQLIALGEKVRGAPFKIEKLPADELENGTFQSSWVPRIDHPSLRPDQVEMMSRIILPGVLLATSKGAWNTSDEWNKLLPDFKFTQPGDFLSEAWHGKP